MLRDKLYADMQKARKDNEKDKLNALSLAWSEITATEKAEKVDKLGDSRFISIINKLIKQDIDTYDAFSNRIKSTDSALESDISNKELLVDRIKIYESYLPQALSEKELNLVIVKAIVKTNSQGKPKNFGAVMRYMIENYNGRFNTWEVSGLIKAKLLQGE